MTVLKLTIYDKDFKYGAHVTFQASLEGYPAGQGNGHVLMFYTCTEIPALNG
jgi:hypothetical protein